MSAPGKKRFNEITQNKSEWFLLAGNGVNLFDRASGAPHWAELLVDLLPSTMNTDMRALLQKKDVHGMTYPEIFDLVVLQTRLSQPALPLPNPPAPPPIITGLKTRIARRLDAFQPNSAHRAVVGFCERNAMPLMTTNFDHALEKVSSCTHFAARRVTTPYYRWETYHAPARLPSPLIAFGIWHVHGSIRVPSSLRLGLNDYAGAIQRVRPDITPFFSWISNGKHGDPPGYAKNLQNTWVEIFLTRHPIIVGLNLTPYEMLLRWLLIQRATVHSKSGQHTCKGIYIRPKADKERVGMNEFLKFCGIEVIDVDDYSDCYDLLQVS
jgi:hypothetical protein